MKIAFSKCSSVITGRSPPVSKESDFAKAFELKASSKDEENWSLSFEWHDDIEGAKLFNDAIRAFKHKKYINI